MQPVSGVKNPSAPLGNLLISQAVDLVDKLLLAASGIDQMGVRIAERREKHPATGIHRSVELPFGQGAHGPIGRNALPVGEQPGIVEGTEAVHLGAADAVATRLVDPRDAGDVPDQQSHVVRRNWIEDSIWGYITWSLSTNGTRLR